MDHLFPMRPCARTARAKRSQQSNEIAADEWFVDWRRGGTLIEESRYLAKWDQCLTILSFEDEHVPQRDFGDDDKDEPLLKELDGVLPNSFRHRRGR